MDEHDGLRERAGAVEGGAELQVLVVLEAHAADDDDVGVGLEGDAREELVVGLAGLGEDRQLLRDDERVKEVDHRDVRAHHPVGHDALRRVYRGLPDRRGVVADGGAAVARHARAGEGAAEEVVRERHLHRLAEEPDARGGVDAPGAGEDLQRHVRPVELDDLREGSAGAAFHLGDFAVFHALCAERRDRPGQRVDFVIDSVVEHAWPLGVKDIYGY